MSPPAMSTLFSPPTIHKKPRTGFRTRVEAALKKAPPLTEDQKAVLNEFFMPDGKLRLYTQVETNVSEEWQDLQILINLCFYVHKSDPQTYQAVWDETRSLYDKFYVLCRRPVDEITMTEIRSLLMRFQKLADDGELPGTTDATNVPFDASASVRDYALAEPTGALFGPGDPTDALSIDELPFILQEGRGTTLGQIFNTAVLGGTRALVGYAASVSAAGIMAFLVGLAAPGATFTASVLATIAGTVASVGTDRFVQKNMQKMLTESVKVEAGTIVAGAGITYLQTAEAQYVDVLRGAIKKDEGSKNTLYEAMRWVVLNKDGQAAHDALILRVDQNVNYLAQMAPGAPSADPTKLFEAFQDLPKDDLVKVQERLVSLVGDNKPMAHLKSIDASVYGKLAEGAHLRTDDLGMRIRKFVTEKAVKFREPIKWASGALTVGLVAGNGFLHQRAIRRVAALIYAQSLVVFQGTLPAGNTSIRVTALDQRLVDLRILLNKNSTSTIETYIKDEHDRARGIRRLAPNVAAATDDANAWTETAAQDREAIFLRLKEIKDKLQKAVLGYYNPWNHEAETVSATPHEFSMLVGPLVDEWNKALKRLVRNRSTAANADGDDGGGGGGNGDNGGEMAFVEQEKVWNEAIGWEGNYPWKIPPTDTQMYSVEQAKQRLKKINDEKTQAKAQVQAEVQRRKKEEQEERKEVKRQKDAAKAIAKAKADELNEKKKAAKAQLANITKRLQKAEKEREAARKKAEKKQVKRMAEQAKQLAEQRQKDMAPQMARVRGTAIGEGQRVGQIAMSTAYANNPDISLGDLMGMAAEAAVDAASDSANGSSAVSSTDLGQIGRAAIAAVKQWWRIHKEKTFNNAGVGGGDPFAEAFAPLLAQPEAEEDNGAGVGVQQQQQQQQQPEAGEEAEDSGEEEEEEGEDSDEEEEEEDEDEDDEEDEDEDSEDDFGDDEAAAPAPAGPRWDGRIDYNAPARSSRDSVVDALFARLAL